MAHARDRTFAGGVGTLGILGGGALPFAGLGVFLVRSEVRTRSVPSQRQKSNGRAMPSSALRSRVFQLLEKVVTHVVHCFNAVFHLRHLRLSSGNAFSGSQFSLRDRLKSAAPQGTGAGSPSRPILFISFISLISFLYLLYRLYLIYLLYRSFISLYILYLLYRLS